MLDPKAPQINTVLLYTFSAEACVTYKCRDGLVLGKLLDPKGPRHVQFSSLHTFAFVTFKFRDGLGVDQIRNRI